MDLTEALLDRAARLLDRLRAQRMMLATAESCTGGLVAGGLTAIAGSSDVVERGFVTYSNAAKAELLGVPPPLIAKHGAVSAQVARAMAEGALSRAPVDVTIAVTGIAGPSGATPGKPVGLVYLAAARKARETLVERHQFAGDRTAVRLASIEAAFDLIDRQLD
jgi:nicotinamide-nucleotide amidase